MASIKTKLPQKITVEQRIYQLSQKMNSVQLKKPDTTNKRYQQIDSACDNIQNQIKQFKNFFDSKLAYIKNKRTKISKQLKKHSSNQLDKKVKQQINNTNQQLLLMIEQQHERQKQQNFRIARYFEQQSSNIKELIEKQAIQREQQGNSICDSLNSDISQIRLALETTNSNSQNGMSSLEQQLYFKSERISEGMRQICQNHQNNEAEFYKILRDLVKKVKSQLQQYKTSRQETQTQILNLIDKMCDKKIENKSD